MEAPSGTYSYTQLQTLVYGPGSINKLPEYVQKYGTRALVVTGQSISTKTDIIQKVKDLIGDAFVDVYTGIGQHAPIAGIQEVVGILKTQHIDLLISVGGGSPIDASKAVIHRYRGEDKEKPPLSHIAIPTTLSAAEYTTNAGYSNEEGAKVSVRSPELAPKVIILDAELTMHTPERLWLSTGMRAVDHAVEALYRPGALYHIREIALAALRDLFFYLPHSKNNPRDIKTRQQLQLASYMSLFPNSETSQGLGLSHSLGHKLGATYSIPHGITTCLTLPTVVKAYCEDGSPEDKAMLERAVQYIHMADIEGQGLLVPRTANLAVHLDGLIKLLGLPSTLKSWKVPKEDLPGIANKAKNSLPNLPFDEAKVLSILEEIY